MCWFAELNFVVELCAVSRRVREDTPLRHVLATRGRPARSEAHPRRVPCRKCSSVGCAARLARRLPTHTRTSQGRGLKLGGRRQDAHHGMLITDGGRHRGTLGGGRGARGRARLPSHRDELEAHQGRHEGLPEARRAAVSPAVRADYLHHLHMPEAQRRRAQLPLFGRPPLATSAQMTRDHGT